MVVTPTPGWKGGIMTKQSAKYTDKLCNGICRAINKSIEGNSEKESLQHFEKGYYYD